MGRDAAVLLQKLPDKSWVDSEINKVFTKEHIS